MVTSLIKILNVFEKHKQDYFGCDDGLSPNQQKYDKKNNNFFVFFPDQSFT